MPEVRQAGGLLSSRLPATMCVRRGCGLSRIDVFLREIALRQETRAVTSGPRSPPPGHDRPRAAVRARAHAELCPEAPRELRRIRPADGRTDGRDGLIGRHQSPGGALGAPAREVVHRRHADGSDELAGEVERADVQSGAELGQRPGMGEVVLQELARLRDELRGRRSLVHRRGPGRVAGRQAVQGDQQPHQLRGPGATFGRQRADGLQGLEHPAQLELVELAHDDRTIALGDGDARRVEQPAQPRVPERPGELELVQLRPEEAVEDPHLDAAAVLVPGAGRDQDDGAAPERLAAARADVQP